MIQIHGYKNKADKMSAITRLTINPSTPARSALPGRASSGQVVQAQSGNPPGLPTRAVYRPLANSPDVYIIPEWGRPGGPTPQTGGFSFKGMIQLAFVFAILY